MHRGHSGGTAALCQQAEQHRRATDDVHRGRYLGRRVALALDLWSLATRSNLFACLSKNGTQEGLARRPEGESQPLRFESPANRDKAAIKREESEARFDYPEVTEQREQTKVSLSVCRVATELAEGNVSRLDRRSAAIKQGGKETTNFASKREQCQTCLSIAEREQARPKGKAADGHVMTKQVRAPFTQGGGLRRGCGVDIKDKHGNKIQVGDAVRTKYGRICRVQFRQTPCFIGYDLTPIEAEHDAPDEFDLWNPCNLEIVSDTTLPETMPESFITI